MAVAGTLDNPDVQCAVSYDGANMGARGKGLGADPEAAAMWKAYGDTLFMLEGWSGTKAEKEIEEYGPQLDLVGRASKLNGRPILLVAADTQVIPIEVHIKPLAEAIKADANHQLEYLLINNDHSFSASRLELIAATAEFLQNSCR